jgi:hypothetical protein
MAYSGIPGTTFTVPGTVTGFLDVRKKGTTGPVITVGVPAYAGGGSTTPTNSGPAVLVSVSGTAQAPKFTATASDMDGVNSIFVKVYDSNNAPVQTFGPSAPGDTTYVTIWSGAAAGNYTAKAVATDTKGASTTSDPVSFTVTAASTGGTPTAKYGLLVGGNSVQNDLGLISDTGSSDTGGGTPYRLQAMVEAGLGTAITYAVSAVYGQTWQALLNNFQSQFATPIQQMQAAGCTKIAVSLSEWINSMDGSGSFQTAQAAYDAAVSVVTQIAALATSACTIQVVLATPSDCYFSDTTGSPAGWSWDSRADAVRQLVLQNAGSTPYLTLDVRADTAIGVSGSAQKGLYHRTDNPGASFYNIHLNRAGSYVLASLNAGAILQAFGKALPSDVSSAGASASGTSVTVTSNAGRWVREFSLDGTNWVRDPQLTAHVFTSLSSGSYTPRVRMLQKPTNVASGTAVTVQGSGGSTGGTYSGPYMGTTPTGNELIVGPRTVLSNDDARVRYSGDAVAGQGTSWYSSSRANSSDVVANAYLKEVAFSNSTNAKIDPQDGVFVAGPDGIFRFYAPVYATGCRFNVMIDGKLAYSGSLVGTPTSGFVDADILQCEIQVAPNKSHTLSVEAHDVNSQYQTLFFGHFQVL